MFEVIESLLEPISFLYEEDLKVGDLISLSYDKQDVYANLANSKNVFGIVVDKTDKKVSILYGLAILKTNNFDSSKKYNVGDLLYSNELGKITNKKNKESSLLLGHLLEAPTDVDKSIEFNLL